MIDVKITFIGGLDLDTSLHVLKKESYIDALNITRDAIQSNEDYAGTNIVGNKKVAYDYPAGQGMVIGAAPNQVRNTIIFMRYNSNGYNGIYEYDRSNNVINKIFECLTDSDTDILNFNTIDKISSINVYNRPEGDLLYFIDCLGRPTCLNITRFKNNEYNPVTRDIINVIKRPPLSPPTAVYNNDVVVQTNNLRKKLFKFQYLWVYDDFEESTLGPESAVPYPLNILDDEFTSVITNNNVINVIINTGPKNVKGIKLLMSWAENSNVWNDFVVVETFDKEKLSLPDNSVYNYSFYNESVYPIYNPERRIQLFDWVPKYALCQEMPNGNVLAYGSVTEGLSRDLAPDVTVEIFTLPAGDGSSTGNLTGKLDKVEGRIPPILEAFISFSGTPAVGTIVNVKLLRASDSALVLIGTYTTVAGDTEYNVRLGLQASMNAINIVQSVDLNTDGSLDFRYNMTQYSYQTSSSIEIISSVGDTAANSIATFPFYSQRSIGIVYFDQNGVTNGVLYSQKISFPAYSENGTFQVLIPYINIKINHTPPEWAYSYQILLTKNNTLYTYWYTLEVDTSETEYLYFNVTNILSTTITQNPTVSSVLSWSFQDGDRVRVIRNDISDTVLSSDYDAEILGILTDPKINGATVTGRYIKIRKSEPFLSYTNWADDNFVIQVYRPTQQEATDDVLTYYELGQQYAIIDPETANRVHSGGVTNQNTSGTIPAETNIYEGDAYFRLRSVYTTETQQISYNVQDRNFVDSYISAVSSISGRPNIIDENSKEIFLGNVIRFGDAYQPNTDVNGLNRFKANSFIEVDYSYGDIKRLKVWDRSLRIFQKLKVGVSPIFSQISRQADGNAVVVTTDILLNPIQYYEGNYGIGDAPESLVAYNNVNYFCDTVRGIICRLSNNGITPISVLYKVNSWASQNIPLRVGPYKIYGSYDSKTNNLIIALDSALVSDALKIGNQGIINYSGIIRASVNLVDTCLSSDITFYSGTPFSTGTVLYSDSSLTTVLSGYNYIAYSDNQIYEIDSVTGEVGNIVSGAICNTGTSGIYKIGNSTDTVCSAIQVELYTNGSFAIGKIMYYDSSLTTTVTGNDYIVDVNGGGSIYNLNTLTGEVGSDTTIDCDTGIAAFYILGNSLATICTQPQVTKYTTTTFGTGVTLYDNSSATTPVTGYSYVVQVSTNKIYEIDTSTGIVGVDTTYECTIGTSQFEVENSIVSGLATVDNVNPIFYLIATGSYPVAPSSNLTGTHGGTASALSVDVSVSSGSGFTLSLYKNGILVGTIININTTGTYAFGAVTFASTDDIKITLT